MRLFGAIDAAASGLTAERLRMDVISNNIANVNTTRTAEGGPYRRQMVVFQPRDNQREFSRILSQQIDAGEGVRVTGITRDESPARLIFDPQHPDANRDGYVEMPNINIVNEMVDMNLTGYNRQKFDQAKQALNKLQQVVYEVSLKFE